MDAQIRLATSAIAAWFEALAPRERRLLVAGGVVLAVALVYDVLWEPAWDGSARIRVSLPELEGQLADMRMLAGEARTLKGAAAIRTPAGIALRDALSVSLREAGISQAKFTVLGKGVQVDAAHVPFGVLMAWLEGVRSTQHVRAVNAHATGDVQPGHANVSVTLEPAGEH